MCCLFGLIDYNNTFNAKEKNRLIKILSTECEARGTDSTGIAFNTESGLHISKRPVAAHKMRYRIPDSSKVVMGHTRMTTQGSEKFNFNNHPFPGHVDKMNFALAHNGVLHNDSELRMTECFPKTNIQTDSYVAVQLRFLYKGIIINHNKKPSQPTLKRRFFKKKAAFFHGPVWERSGADFILKRKGEFF